MGSSNYASPCILSSVMLQFDSDILFVNVYAQAGEKLFSRMVNAFKDTATVKHARKTATSTSFELLPTCKPNDTELSHDNTESTQSSTVDKPFTLEELRKLRSKDDSAESDKS